MFANIGPILLAALGISFLIFIHELGHFLAARFFGVRVEIFSVGFGPRLFGFRRGDTDYRFSAVPLGGYVKMAGEYGDYDDERPLAPDDLNAKPAWQRAVVFSAGVIVNFGFAFIVFPIAFAMGVPFMAPVLGVIAPGGAAWQAGLLPGDEILSVNGNPAYQFSDVALEVALADPEHTKVTVRRGDAVVTVPLRPTRNTDAGRYEIGISPALDPRIQVTPGGPAERAGLQDGDHIVAIDGTQLEDAIDGAATLIVDVMQSGEPVTIEYERDGTRHEATVEAKRQENPERPVLGMLPVATRVAGLRGLAASSNQPLLVGDTVLAVAGQLVTDATALRAALLEAPAGDVPLRVRRDGEEQLLTLPAALRDPVAAGDAALELDWGGTTVRISDDGALADAGLQSGATILSLNGVTLDGYADLQERVSEGGGRYRLVYQPADGSAPATVEVDSRPIPLWDYGLAISALQVFHKESIGGAIRAGIHTSMNFLRTTWLTLTKLVTGDVAAKNLGGIVSISVISYHFAESGFTQLLFFLGLLSINLGFINILPVPVLDGGQVMFLIFEKIKGSQLSERFMNSMQIAGLLAIVALVVYVTYQDIVRLVG
ncbi:MAG: RIP metalloprotease RseP [Planctomycetota bacterium]|jgi:regulator of sigma E protease